MTISAILFDKDGTLLDYHRTWTPINLKAALYAADGRQDLAQALLVAGGWEEASGRVRAGSVLAAGHTTELAELWRRHGSGLPQAELVTGIDRMFAAGMAEAVPVTDLPSLFGALSPRGLALGIASSDSAAAVTAFVEQFELHEFLDFEAGYDSGHGVKPGPGMLQAFCRVVGHAPSKAAVVGDNLHDMAMAENGGAGLRIAVLTGTGTHAQLEPESDFCIDSIDGFDTFLVSIGALSGAAE